MSGLLTNEDYKTWLVDLKTKIKQSQIKAALAVNSQLIRLYWDLGSQIVEKQKTAKWGSGFIDQLSKDLQEEFPEMSGFSKNNLYRVRSFYQFYFQYFTKVAQVVPLLETRESIAESARPNGQQTESQQESIDNQPIRKLAQVVPQLDHQFDHPFDAKLENELFQIPWGHHVLILQKIKNQPEAIFYIRETIENNWSRAVSRYSAKVAPETVMQNPKSVVGRLNRTNSKFGFEFYELPFA